MRLSMTMVEMLMRHENVGLGLLARNLFLWIGQNTRGPEFAPKSVDHIHHLKGGARVGVEHLPFNLWSTSSFKTLSSIVLANPGSAVRFQSVGPMLL